MTVSVSRRGWLLAAYVIGAAVCLQPLAAQTAGDGTASPVTRDISVRPGQQVVLDTAPCLVAIQPVPGGALEIARVSDTRMHAVFTAPAAETSSPVVVIVERGTSLTTDGKACESPVRSQFNISVDRTPEVPPGALEQSFRILMAVFVLAVLLENAFALLFNWRLFLEFFVGKAWRTPIMFFGALIIVRTFELDLVAQLFRAYNPGLNPQTGVGIWFTSAITAMVLAGGSVGVNRVFVALGFRSQLRPEALEPELEPTEAYVAIHVQGHSSRSMCQVNMDVVDPIPADTPRTLGFVGGAAGIGARLRELLFPVRSRIPQSGGMRVATTKAYRISVTDLEEGKHYDTLGRPITSTSQSQLFAFAPKAIVDFTIRLKGNKT
jgi:hypothetical protein